MFRGVNVAHKYVNAEVGAALPRFLPRQARCSLFPFGQQKRSRFVASPLPSIILQGNVLRRLLTPDEYDDIRHYEILFVEGRTGINLTHGLKKGNMYVAITSRNLHFCPMSGVKRDVVVTVPLSEIDNVELKGHPGKQFFYSHIWGTHKANKFAKRLKLTRKKKTEFVPEGDWSPEEEAGQEGAGEDNGAPPPALPEPAEAKRQSFGGWGKSGPVVESTSTSTPLGRSEKPRNFNFWEAMDNLTPPGPGPVTESAEHAAAPETETAAPPEPINTKPLEKAGPSFDVAAAVSAATYSPPESPDTPPAAFKWTQQEQTTDSDFDFEHINIVTYEVGSQVQYQLESAVVRNQGRISVRDAETQMDLARAAEGEADSAAEWGRVQSALADVFPRDMLAYAAEMNDADGWTFGATGIDVAAQMTDQTRHVSRREDGSLLFDGSSLREAPPALPPVPSQTAYQSLEPNEGALIDQSPHVSNPMLEKARNGMMLAAALAPALRVAGATIEAAQAHAQAVAGGANPARDRNYARETFGTLELMMLAPVEMAEKGLNIAVESVSPLDCEDLCAAAAMTEHFKRVPRMRKLALGSRTLFDVTINRLTKSVMEATYPRPSLLAARRKGDNLGSPTVNWNRLLHAARQGASAHRAVQLFAWVRAALGGAEGAAHERADIVGRYESLAALVHACFVFEPEKHRATAPPREFEDVDVGDEDGDHSDTPPPPETTDATRLRAPAHAVSTGVIDLIVDVLYECARMTHHAHLMGAGDEVSQPPKHVAAHVVKARVTRRAFRPKVSAMFQRLINLVLDAQHRGNGAVTGAAAVRAHRCAYVLRHLIEGTGDGSVAACVEEEYPMEMNYVMTRPEVMSVMEAGGDEFFRRHVKPDLDFVLAECVPHLLPGKRDKQREAAEELKGKSSATMNTMMRMAERAEMEVQ